VNPTAVTLNHTALPRPHFTHGATLRFDLAP
jgi:hypothetical protein